MYKYKRFNINVEDLKLDENNPRFITFPEDVRKNIFIFILKELESSMRELILDILKLKELNPIVTIAVLNENDEWVVKDGNRRIAALKVLLMDERKWNNFELDYIKNIWKTKSIEIKEFQKEWKEIRNNQIEVVDLENKEKSYVWTRRIHVQTGGETTTEWLTINRNIQDKNFIAVFLNDFFQKHNLDYFFNVKIKWAIWFRIFQLKIFRIFFRINVVNKIINIENEKEFLEKINVMIILFEENKWTYSNNFYDIEIAKETIKKIDNKIKLIHNINNIEKLNFKNSKEAFRQTIETSYFNKNKLKIKKKNKKFFNNLEEILKLIKFEKSKNILCQINYLLLLKKIKDKNIKNFNEIIAISLRNLIEVSINYFLYKNKICEEKKIRDYNFKFLERLKSFKKYFDCNKHLIKLENKSSFFNFLSDLPEIWKKLSEKIHDYKLIIGFSETKEIVKKLEIFLFEIWNNME